MVKPAISIKLVEVENVLTNTENTTNCNLREQYANLESSA